MKASMDINTTVIMKDLGKDYYDFEKLERQALGCSVSMSKSSMRITLGTRTLWMKSTLWTMKVMKLTIWTLRWCRDHPPCGGTRLYTSPRMLVAARMGNAQVRAALKRGQGGPQMIGYAKWIKANQDTIMKGLQADYLDEKMDDRYFEVNIFYKNFIINDSDEINTLSRAYNIIM